MSRIGKRILEIPEGMQVDFTKKVLTVSLSGKELKLNIDNGIDLKIENGTIETIKKGNSKHVLNVWGTTNSLIENMIIGLKEGFVKNLETVGVGYKFAVSGKILEVFAGYSNPVKVEIPEGISIEQINNTEISIKGIDKQQVGEVAANIRKIRKPEPYKGKGIRYKGEIVRRKEGKKAA